MITYPHKCSICKMAAINNICSNSKCKSWRKYRQLAADHKIIEQGLTSEVPIIVNCKNCNECVFHNGCQCKLCFNASITCLKCYTYDYYTHIKNRWYMSKSTGGISIIMYLGLINDSGNAEWWDFSNQRYIAKIV